MTLPRYSRCDLVARVLAHGAMTRADLRHCMGWDGRLVDGVLRRLCERSEVRPVRLRHRAVVYHLTDIARVPRYYDYD